MSCTVAIGHGRVRWKPGVNSPPALPNVRGTVTVPADTMWPIDSTRKITTAPPYTTSIFFQGRGR